MGQLMGQGLRALTAPRRGGAAADHDVVTHGVCPRAQRFSAGARGWILMDAHPAKVLTQASLHEPPRASVKGLATRPLHHPGRRRASGAAQQAGDGLVPGAALQLQHPFLRPIGKNPQVPKGLEHVGVILVQQIQRDQHRLLGIDPGAEALLENRGFVP